MTPLEIADQLRREADEIIHDRGLDAVLQPRGRVVYCGSYALNVMAWPDLDIHIVMEPDPHSLDEFFAIGREIAKIDGVCRFSFRNTLVEQIPNLPPGYYWGTRLQLKEREQPWKIDLWATDAGPYEKTRIWMAKVRQAMNEDQRRRIVEIKQALLTPEGRTPVLSGFHIVEAVVFAGLTAEPEIRAYLREHGVEGV